MRAVVQHHGSRVSILPRLLERLEGFDVTVAEDSGDVPDPWRGYRRALAALGKHDGVVLQDDSLPVDGFHEKLSAAVENTPDCVLCLFVSSQPARTAREATRALRDRVPSVPFHMGDRWVPVVANYYPAGIAECVLEWASCFPSHRHTRSDDHMIGQWFHQCRYPVRILVPSLVDHPDDVPSLIGNGRGAHGRNPARRALHLA